MFAFLVGEVAADQASGIISEAVTEELLDPLLAAARERQLTEFYQQHNPGQVESVASLLKHHAFKDICRDLQKTYGVVPEGWDHNDPPVLARIATSGLVAATSFASTPVSHCLTAVALCAQGTVLAAGQRYSRSARKGQHYVDTPFGRPSKVPRRLSRAFTALKNPTAYRAFATQMEGLLAGLAIGSATTAAQDFARAASGLMKAFLADFPRCVHDRRIVHQSGSGECAADPDDTNARVRATKRFVEGLSRDGDRTPAVGEPLLHPDTGAVIAHVQQVSEPAGWTQEEVDGLFRYSTYWVDFALAENAREEPELMWVPRAKAVFVETDCCSRFPQGFGTLMPTSDWAPRQLRASNCLCCTVTVKRDAGIFRGQSVDLTRVGVIQLACAPPAADEVQRRAFFGAVARGRPWLRLGHVTRGSALPTVTEAQKWVLRVREDLAGDHVLCDTDARSLGF
jgi:hypothetical protein